MAHSCKDCKKRYLGCHDECESYQKFHQKRMEINRQRLKDRLLNENDRMLSTHYRKLNRQLP